MNKLLICLAGIILMGCKQTGNKNATSWKTMEVGDYLFDFPSDFSLKPGEGVDSYVGEITGDSMQFGFDFGYYSDDFDPTPAQYLESGYWRGELSSRFMQPGISYDAGNMPRVNVLHIRPATAADSALGKGCDYVASCRHDTMVFDYAVYLPATIKQTHYVIDTVQQLYRKIVWATDPEKGITGIYLRKVNGFNTSMNSYLALSMAANGLTPRQQQLALRIFRTGRHK